MITESIYSDGEYIIPMADVAYCTQSHPEDTGSKVYTLRIILKSNQEIEMIEWASKPESQRRSRKFLTAWQTFRGELDNVATPEEMHKETE